MQSCEHVAAKCIFDVDSPRPMDTAAPTSQEPLAAAAAQELLRDIDTVIFDCDGVLWTGSNVVPGAARCIAALHAAGKRTLFMTNNSSSSRQDLLGKFEKMGLAGVTREMIYNSGYVRAARVEPGTHLPPELCRTPR